MNAGTLAAALGRSFGRFLEAWGNDFDYTDPHDLEALAHLLHQELDVATDREAARKARKLVEEWGGTP